MKNVDFYDELHGAVFKLHYGHIHNGNPNTDCAMTLAVDDMLTEKGSPRG